MENLVRNSITVENLYSIGHPLTKFYVRDSNSPTLKSLKSLLSLYDKLYFIVSQWRNDTDKFRTRPPSRPNFLHFHVAHR